jgi:outer membrane lipase/esterase
MADQPATDVNRKRLRRIPILLATACAAALSSAAEAKLYVFGDSLSDNGNIDKVTFGVEPGDDYVKGRFSNGPVWTELLGYRLGRAPGLLYYDPVLTSRVDGYNFAHGGAAAVERWFLPDFLEAPGQTSYYARQVRRGRMSGNSSDIATLWIGGNDYLNYDEGSVPTVVGGVMKSLTALDATGVGRIVLMNLPLLGEIPGEIKGPDRARLNALSQQHNALLNASVAAFRPAARSEIIQVNIGALFNLVRQGRVGGFTVTRPGQLGSRTGTCRGDGLILAACPSNYFFYDGVHPTASGHSFIASVVRDRLAAPIAAAARVSLGQASSLSTLTAQLGQVQTRLAAKPGPDGAVAYRFGSGDAAQDSQWSQGFGADWRHGSVTLGMNVIEAENDAALGDGAAMKTAGEGLGYSVYAAFQDDGLTAALAMTSLSTGLSFSRQTEIEGMGTASGQGGVTASSLQTSIAQKFDDGGFSIRPELSLTWTQLDFAPFTETGTLGLSDNVYEAHRDAGTLAGLGATIQYASEDWGVSLRTYGVGNLEGRASIWTLAPSAMIGRTGLTPDGENAQFGAGMWAQIWLAEGGEWSLSAEGGAFTDTQRTEGAGQVSFKLAL